MKILIFSPTSGNYKLKKPFAGWICAFENSLKSVSDVTLGMAFLHSETAEKIEADRITYYPMQRNGSFFSKVSRFFWISRQDKSELKLCLKVIEDFKPDLIHVFGTETSFGLITKHTNVPVIIHLQGLLHPYINAWLPPGYALKDYFLSEGLAPTSIAGRIRAWRFNKYAASRELRIMRTCKYFMGRTHWDKAFCEFNGPQAQYFHCDELLRNSFYCSDESHAPAIPTFMTTISNPLYKGQDMLLKTAKELKSSGFVNFKWKVFGVKSLRFAEKKTGIVAKDVNIEVCGLVPADVLKNELLQSTAFIHPSYIDNSPNSICEAQMLGIPVIACNVGGVASIVENNETGFLVPANDPGMMAYMMQTLLRDKEKAKIIGDAGRHCAQKRHDQGRIIEQLTDIYRKVLSETNSKTQGSDLR